MTDLFDKAYLFAERAHAGQNYKTGAGGKVMAYFEHAKRVAERVAAENPDASPELLAVAFLHDTVEDTSATLDQIRSEFGDTVASAVDAITRRPGETYMAYIERLCPNVLAVDVKIADLRENIYWSYRSALPNAVELRGRYVRALNYILAYVRSDREGGAL